MHVRKANIIRLSLVSPLLATEEVANAHAAERSPNTSPTLPSGLKMLPVNHPDSGL